MRLTLRTLLAYLDDRLSPANARELGQKIAASPFATELAERIKDVVRRRRLAREAMTSKSIDANLVAEYLDDQLTPELVALIEKEILSSDVSLAEVAATHQIIGLLADPVEVPQALRQRLYALAERPTNEAVDSGESSKSQSHQQSWQPLKPAGEHARRSPTLLLAIMVLGWLALIATDADLFQSSDKVGPDDGVESVQAPAAEGDGAAQRPVPEVGESGIEEKTKVGEQIAASTPIPPSDSDAAGAGATEQPAGAASADVSVASKASATTETEPPEAVASVTAPGKAATAAEPVDPGSSASKMAPPETAQNPPDSDQPPQEPVVTAGEKPKEEFQLVDDFRMVIVQPEQTAEWVPVTAIAKDRTVAQVMTAGTVAVLQPYRAQLLAPESGWSATFLGPSTFRLMEGDDNTVHVIEGRLLVSHYAADHPAEVSLSCGRRRLKFSLPQQKINVAIEVIPLAASAAVGAAEDDEGVSLLPLNHLAVVRISSPDADLSVRISDSDEPIVVGRGSTWQWNTGMQLSTPNSTMVSNMIPEWVFAAAQPINEQQMELLTAVSLVYRKGTTVTDAAVSLTGDTDPGISELGVAHLGQMRNVEDLVQVLFQTDNFRVRHAAANWLQRILHEQPAARDLVRKTLETLIPETEIQDAMDLLSGFSPTSVEQARNSERLVDLLSHSRTAIRDLAILNLMRLTGKDSMGYFADDDPSRRQAAIKRWRRFLDQHQGRLVQPPQ